MDRGGLQARPGAAYRPTTDANGQALPIDAGRRRPVQAGEGNQAIETPEQHEAPDQWRADGHGLPAAGPRRLRWWRIDTHISRSFSPATLLIQDQKASRSGLSTPPSARVAREQACRNCARTGVWHSDIYLMRRRSPVPPMRLVDGGGPVIDWAVVMRRFDPDADPPGGGVDPSLIARLARRVAGFHAGAR